MALAVVLAAGAAFWIPDAVAQSTEPSSLTAPPRLRTLTEPRLPQNTPSARSLLPGTVATRSANQSETSERLFSGPIDPDTQDQPTTGEQPPGTGSRIGFGRDTTGNTADSPSGLRLNPLTTTSDTLQSQAGSSSNALQSPTAVEGSVGGMAPVQPVDGDVDVDLRRRFDDDLRVETDVDETPLTGPTVGAATILRDRLVRLRGMTAGFAVPARPAYPEDDERPFEQPGLRAGSFRILPSITASTIVTDNVFNAAGGKETDVGVELRPQLRIESDWNRHAVSLDATGGAVFYNEFESENTTDFSAAARARLDVTLRTNVELEAAYQIASEERGSVNSTADAVEEPDVETLLAGVTLNHRFNRLVTRTRLGYSTEINGDAVRTDGTTASGADDNFQRFDAASRLTYEFSPAFAAFVEGAYNEQRFDAPADSDGFLRDSDGYELRLGARMEIGPAIVAEVSAGYAAQMARAGNLNDVDGFVFDADVLWRPSALTSVNLNMQTDINSSSVAGTLGSFAYQTSLSVRHEFRRYAIGTLGLTWRREDFDTVDIVEDELTFQIGGEYIFNRNLAALATYEFTDFNSSLADSDYQSNVFRLGVRLQR